MLEYKSEIIGNPQQLVVFLHGYNGNLEDHAEAIGYLRKYLQNCLLCLPLAPEICDKNPHKRQWFGMLKHDNENRRYNPDTSTVEIIEIYNHTAEDIEKQSININNLIKYIQVKHKIASLNTFIIGFSQGAMLALYAGLSAQETYGGVFMLSGLVAAEKRLVQQIKQKPAVYLFHGEKDEKVQYKTLTYTNNWLNSQKINHKIFTYPTLVHKVYEEEIKQIGKIISGAK